MKLKHNFEVNQVWISEKYPEKSFYIYQINHPDYDDAWLENENSFYEAVLINKKLFEQIVDEYQEKHNVKDRSVTYPYCMWKEGLINSLKQYVRKWECVLSHKEEFEITEYEGGEFVVVKDERKAFDVIWEKYSK